MPHRSRISPQEDERSRAVGKAEKRAARGNKDGWIGSPRMADPTCRTARWRIRPWRLEIPCWLLELLTLQKTHKQRKRPANREGTGIQRTGARPSWVHSPASCRGCRGKMVRQDAEPCTLEACAPAENSRPPSHDICFHCLPSAAAHGHYSSGEGEGGHGDPG